MATSFSCGRSRSVRTEPPTMGKQLVNFITCGVVFKEVFEDTKRTNNDLQKITHKTKDRATRIPQKPELNSGAPEGLAVPAPLE